MMSPGEARSARRGTRSSALRWRNQLKSHSIHPQPMTGSRPWRHRSSIGMLRWPACGRKARQAGPGQQLEARCRFLQRRRHPRGGSNIGVRECQCRAMACPSSNARRTIGAVSGVMCRSMTKKVARTPWRRGRRADQAWPRGSDRRRRSDRQWGRRPACAIGCRRVEQERKRREVREQDEPGGGKQRQQHHAGRRLYSLTPWEGHVCPNC